MAFPFIYGVPPIELWGSLSTYVHPGIACLASQSSDWLGALWASLSGIQSSMTFVRLNVIDCCQGGMFNCPASTCWLIDCALAHYLCVLSSVNASQESCLGTAVK